MSRFVHIEQADKALPQAPERPSFLRCEAILDWRQPSMNICWWWWDDLRHRYVAVGHKGVLSPADLRHL